MFVSSLAVGHLWQVPFLFFPDYAGSHLGLGFRINGLIQLFLKVVGPNGQVGIVLLLETVAHEMDA